MDIIKTSIVFTKTIRNVARLKEIVTVFAKNGFDEFINSGITSHIPDFVLPSSRVKIKEELAQKSARDWPMIIGNRLRKCFEELGPSFVKLGQLLSTREDLFDESFIDEMKKLRDQALPIPFETAKNIIEQSLGLKITDIFSNLNQQPIGKASIGVVFEGTLKDGQEVVVKVKRPGIEKIIETDFSILAFLISQLEKFSDEIKQLALSKILVEFEASLHNELNFNIEALNGKRFQKIIDKYDNQENKLFRIPHVYEEYTGEDVLVLEKIVGIPFSSKADVDKLNEGLTDKLQKAIEIFSKMYLHDGYFHADLHGGNMFLLPTGEIGIIDFGSMGNLSRKARHNFVAIIYSLLTHNYENLIYEFLDVAEYSAIPDVDKIIGDIKQELRPYIGLTAKEINSTQLLHKVIRTITKHDMFVPRDWVIVFRSLITLDGVSKSLRLDCDFFGILESNIKEIIASSFNKDEVIEDSLWAMKDILSTARLVPRHLKWFIKEWTKEKFAFEVKISGHEKEIVGIYSALLFLSFAILSAAFMFAGVLCLDSGKVKALLDISILSWVFWSLSCFFMITGFMVLRKGEK